MKKILTLLLLLPANYVCASESHVESAPTKVVLISSYTSFGGGDVIFRIAQPHASCPRGYWLSKSDPGFQANLSMIIAAKQSAGKVRVVAHPDQLWQGISGVYCFNFE